MSMSYDNSRARWLGATAIALVLAVTAPAPASAQLFFDWGGSQQKVNDTGRMVVRIVTDHKPGEIIVSFSDRKLYLMTGPGMAISYPVAIPREQDRWEGTTSVSQKRENPSWTPTPTMIKENPRLPRWVPGGHPMNPLGNRALYLGSSLYRIHGTDAPWTIGTAVSKGCIRMYNKDALDVYEKTKVGAKVLVTWKQYQFTPVDGQDQQAQSQSQMPKPQEAMAPAPSSPASRASRAVDAGRHNDSGSVPEMGSRRPRVGNADADFTNPYADAAPERPTRTPRADAAAKSRGATTASGTSQGAGAVPAAPAHAQAQSRRTKDRTAAAGASPAHAALTDGTAAAASPIETGSMPVAKAAVAPEAEAAPAPARVAPVVRTQVHAAPSAAAGDDMAARALVAAERAAAAAERAAAAAERAERAAKAAPATPTESAHAPAAND